MSQNASETGGHRAGPGAAEPLRLQRSVRECLARARSRWRVLRVLEGVGAVLAALGFCVVALFGLDNLFHVAPWARLALLVGVAAWVLVLLVRGVFLKPGRSLSDEGCALVVERGHRSLENRLINAVTFRRRNHSGVEATVVDLVEDEAATRLLDLRWSGILDVRRTVRFSAWAVASLCLVGAYAWLLPDHFQNAVARFASPLSDVSPLTRTRLAVSPGDAEISAGDGMTVRVEVEGVLPEKAWLHTSHGAVILMGFDGRFFEHRMSGVTAGFGYHVRAGDARSREFRVRVLRPPEVQTLDVTIHRPEYTGLPPRTEEGSSGNVDALEGSRIVLEILATRPLRAARILCRDGDKIDMGLLGPQRFQAEVVLNRDIDYEFQLDDGESRPLLAEEVGRKLRALPDAPPECEIIEPARERAVAPASSGSLPVTVRVADDVGLASARLFVAPGSLPQDGDVAVASNETRPGPGVPLGSWRQVATWEGIRSREEAVVAAGVRLLDVVDSRGDLPACVLLRAVAVDLKGTEQASSTRTVRLLASRGAAPQLAEALGRFRSGLADILRREKALEGRTAALAGEETQPQVAVPSERSELVQMGEEQYDIRSALLSCLARASSEMRAVLDPVVTRDLRRELERLADDVMPEVALRLLSASGTGSGDVDSERRDALLAGALAGEKEIIDVLSRVLGVLEELVRKSGSGGLDSGDAGASLASLQGVGDRMRDLLEKVREFNQEQREVLARSRELEGKRPEDFTESELEMLDELVATEEKWGKLLEEEATDLSKVAPQDMSIGTLAEEVVELIEEIDLAADYLDGRNIELAVPVEQAGVALSEELETNIERWLMRDRDRLKWVMEEPVGEFDVPLADLPSELEDIVGDLIDREELMTTETEDITSSWLDSMDDGIGWDAMDGPISNMSAKGVTGNLQPNDMEIGGRSGEGRAGKSQGQFVEETATGKGGRQTPSRSTPDPFESGEVKDIGKDPSGGSTGGGKLAGAGPEGLRGPPSPELDRRLGSLARQQMSIRQEAEKLDLTLRRRRYYPQNLDRALELMKTLEEDLTARRRSDYEGLRKQIVSELRDLERVAATWGERRVERAARLPPLSEPDLTNAAGEEAPAEYGDLIRDYYRALGRSKAEARGEDESQ